MKVPLSWLQDYVDLTLPIPELAARLTLAGLEVEEIRIVGWPMPAEDAAQRKEFKIAGLAWDADKLVTAAVSEVMPHPNADRLVLCRLDDGAQQHIVLTGAPNLQPYKGMGLLDPPLKVAYAREGARIYDGHQPGQVLTTLKRTKIRGTESYSMICSEKELGISDEHDGVILLDPDAPVGVSLADYMGDAVFEIALTPNLARDANILGVAREVSAITGAPLHPPSLTAAVAGASITGLAQIEIQNPELNPRFVLGLIRDVEIGPSPYWVQRRLRLAGMRPINNIVDATNYAMLEIGQPLHAFDYDVLVQRAGGPPTIITRTAAPNERLKTLDEVTRPLDPFTVLVCDTAGPLSIAGVMGGLESEVTAQTHTVLLEGAAWNNINIRRTVAAQKLPSEAAYRFSRGVHPMQAERGVQRGLALMSTWSGGAVAPGLVDEYPQPRVDPTVGVTSADAKRLLGLDLSAEEIARILRALEFNVTVTGETVTATTPDHRLDIGEGLEGVADLLEEVARIYGYDRIPETRLADELPPQRNHPELEWEEHLRDRLVELGLQEVATYRLTSPEREARSLPPEAPADPIPYVRLANPIAADRIVMRHSLLASLLEVAERNARTVDRLAIFEIGPVFLGTTGGLPQEAPQLGLLLGGARTPAGWQPSDRGPLDFYDLKGIVLGMLDRLHLPPVRFEPTEHPSFHPGKCAAVHLDELELGVLGELHPLVQRQYDLGDRNVLAALFSLEALLAQAQERYVVRSVATFPPVLEDLAVIVPEELAAGQVETLIRQTGGKLVSEVRLFDVYRSETLGAGQKSLAYSLTYLAPDRTLTDKEVTTLRQRIIRRLENELGARIRIA